MLPDFLKRQLGNPAAWNCSTIAADWCMELGHPDFAAAWRDTIALDACDAATRDTGLVALWDAGIGDGLRVVGDPDAGDIAVVEAMGIEAGAIFTGERWVLRGPRGLHWLGQRQVRLLKAWRP